MYLRGCSDAAAPDDLLVKEEAEALGFMSGPVDSRAGSLLEDSIAAPGVLGVFADEPKEAKAPEPRPKAEEAPLVGEATPVVVKGVMPLRGVLAPPGALSPPNRLVAENVRDPSGLVLFSLVVLELVKDVLLELSVSPISDTANSSGGSNDPLGTSLPEVVHEAWLSFQV